MHRVDIYIFLADCAVNKSTKGFIMGTRIQKAYGVGGPLISVFPAPILAQRAPTSSDTSYPQGQVWFDNSVIPAVGYEFDGSTSWQAGGNAQATTTISGITRYATYAEVSTGTGTNNASLAADVYTYINTVAIAGAPVSTTATAGIGNLATNAQAVAGTASTGTTALFVTPSNLSAVFAANPAIGTTTPAAATVTALTAVGIVRLNASGTAATTIGGSSGAITIATGAGNFSLTGGGNTVGIANDDAANTVTIGSTNSTSTTTIQSGSGNVVVTGGNLRVNSAGKGLQIHHGAVTDMIGTGVLTAGTQTILNTNIATGDMIILQRVGVAASTTLGELTYTISNGTSFTVTSVILGTPGSTQTGDVSTYAWMVVRPA